MRYQSPSGNSTLAILQPIDGAQGGNRGKIALFEKSRMLWSAQVQNPQDGCVADCGCVFVVDQKYNTAAGYVRVYDKSGRMAVQKINSALGRCGLTGDQQLFWCEIYRDKAKSLSTNRIALFRIGDGSIVTTFDDPRDSACGLKGGIKTITFHGQSIAFVAENGCSAELDIAGNVLNGVELSRQYQEQRIHSNDGYILYNLATERLLKKQISDLNDTERESLKDILSRADKGDISPNTHATINKLLGEIAIFENDSGTALRCFEVALRWNPKIGLKRRVESMRK